jgi:hypothetical protein
VNGSIRTALERELERERATGGDLLATGAGKSSAVAGEVTAAGVERVLDGIARKRLGLSNVHMSVRYAQEGSGQDGHAAERGHGAKAEHVREVRCVW